MAKTQLDHVVEKIDEMREDVRVIRHWINGNGQPGAKVRLDRLEQSDARKTWYIRAMLTAGLGAIAAYLAALFKS